MSYEFASNGGCARCDATDGYYEDEPGHPHPNCRCSITALVGGHYRTHDLYLTEWDDVANAVILHYHIYVECCQGLGATYQDDVEVVFPLSVTVGADGVEKWEIGVPEDEKDAEIDSQLDAAFRALEAQCNCFMCC